MNQHYDKTVVVLRLVASGSADTERFQTHISALKCQIQPLEDAPVELIDGVAGKDFLMFSDEADIKIGDKVQDGSSIYLVEGIDNYEFEGRSHTETRIRLPK